MAASSSAAAGAGSSAAPAADAAGRAASEEKAVEQPPSLHIDSEKWTKRGQMPVPAWKHAAVSSTEITGAAASATGAESALAAGASSTGANGGAATNAGRASDGNSDDDEADRDDLSVATEALDTNLPAGPVGPSAAGASWTGDRREDVARELGLPAGAGAAGTGQHDRDHERGRGVGRDGGPGRGRCGAATTNRDLKLALFRAKAKLEAGMPMEGLSGLEIQAIGMSTIHGGTLTTDGLTEDDKAEMTAIAHRKAHNDREIRMIQTMKEAGVDFRTLGLGLGLKRPRDVSSGQGLALGGGAGGLGGLGSSADLGSGLGGYSEGMGGAYSTYMDTGHVGAGAGAGPYANGLSSYESAGPYGFGDAPASASATGYGSGGYGQADGAGQEYYEGSDAGHYGADGQGYYGHEYAMHGDGAGVSVYDHGTGGYGAGYEPQDSAIVDGHGQYAQHGHQGSGPGWIGTGADADGVDGVKRRRSGGHSGDGHMALEAYERGYGDRDGPEPMPHPEDTAAGSGGGDIAGGSAGSAQAAADPAVDSVAGWPTQTVDLGNGWMRAWSHTHNAFYWNRIGTAQSDWDEPEECKALRLAQLSTATGVATTATGAISQPGAGTGMQVTDSRQVHATASGVPGAGANLPPHMRPFAGQYPGQGWGGHSDGSGGGSSMSGSGHSSYRGGHGHGHGGAGAGPGAMGHQDMSKPSWAAAGPAAGGHRPGMGMGHTRGPGGHGPPQPSVQETAILDPRLISSPTLMPPHAHSYTGAVGGYGHVSSAGHRSHGQLGGTGVSIAGGATTSSSGLDAGGPQPSGAGGRRDSLDIVINPRYLTGNDRAQFDQTRPSWK